MNPTTRKPPTAEWLTRPGGIAQRLKQARTAAKLAGKELAERAGWSPSKVSRLEAGQQMPSSVDIDVWAERTDLGADDTASLHRLLDEVQSARSEWARRLRGGMASVQLDYKALEAESARICYFDTTWIPGLLQTRDYARMVATMMADLHRTSRDEIEAAVAVRMERQQCLYDTGKQFELLVAEPVLRWLLCPPDVMRGQLDRLQTVIGMPNVRFGVLPLSAPIALAPQNAFQIYDDLAIVETFTAEDQRTGPEAEKYKEIMAKLWEDAAEGEDARRLIVTAAASLPG
jgi:transcriptional regulator with XRE-family HTH domain